MTGWRKRQVIELARKAGFEGDSELTWEGVICTEELEAFAELVRADERNRTWTQEHWTEYERNIAATERELCAKVCEDIGRAEEMQAIGNDYAEAIRARRDKHD